MLYFLIQQLYRSPWQGLGAYRELDGSAPRPLSFFYASLYLYLCLTTHTNGLCERGWILHLLIEPGLLDHTWMLPDLWPNAARAGYIWR